ncbi:hypothetical protein IF2G_03876 [Cordyceps javanica]|nr:hypothetical protein IF2G_03876 [Cordyceps javanica]
MNGEFYVSRHEQTAQAQGKRQSGEGRGRPDLGTRSRLEECILCMHGNFITVPARRFNPPAPAVLSVSSGAAVGPKKENMMQQVYRSGLLLISSGLRR